MKTLRTVRTALRALRRNVTRAMLTMLGIVIGIAAVIAMMEIGQGSSVAIQKTIASMGTNNLMIIPGASSSSGVSWGAGSAVSLTAQDCEAIVNNSPDVQEGAVTVRISAQLVYGNRNWIPNTIFGTSPTYLDVYNWQDLTEGECFTDRDVRNANKVCLLGQTIKRELFGEESPVGKDVRLNNMAFRVIGVLSAKGANLMGWDQDDVILAPWTTLKYRVSNKSSVSTQAASTSTSTSDQVNTLSKLYPTQQVSLYPQVSTIQAADQPMPVRFANIDRIVVAARSTESIPLAIEQITSVLRERHRIKPDEIDDFQIRDMTELTKTLTSTSALMTRLLLAVALISLVVGGVGIMNIMLVSVTERTREIGLRMSVGARSHDILTQFLIEAVTLCLLGGLIGIALGRGASMLVATFLHWPTEVSLNAIILSVVVAGSVGIVFGFYPAWRASRLDPIEALRYE